MPKMKTHTGAKKRFERTATGKYEDCISLVPSA